MEIILAVLLLVPYRTPLVAKATGILLLIFGQAMTFNIGIKPPLDYLVFAASAAAFALSYLTESKREIRTTPEA